jgi:hypothetical protein
LAKSIILNSAAGLRDYPDNYSPKKDTPARGWQEKRPAKTSSFSDKIAATILKSGE